MYTSERIGHRHIGVKQYRVSEIIRPGNHHGRGIQILCPARTGKESVGLRKLNHGRRWQVSMCMWREAMKHEGRANRSWDRRDNIIEIFWKLLDYWWSLQHIECYSLSSSSAIRGMSECIFISSWVGVTQRECKRLTTSSMTRPSKIWVPVTGRRTKTLRRYKSETEERLPLFSPGCYVSVFFCFSSFCIYSWFYALEQTIIVLVLATTFKDLGSWSLLRVGLAGFNALGVISLSCLFPALCKVIRDYHDALLDKPSDTVCVLMGLSSRRRSKRLRIVMSICFFRYSLSIGRIISFFRLFRVLPLSASMAIKAFQIASLLTQCWYNV